MTTIRHLGDITKISGRTAPIVDCIIGGSPCQDLSVANGNREGLDGERSGLYMEQIRIVKEMRSEDEARGRTGVDIRPRYMLWENVPGAFSSNKGEDFRIVLEEIAKVKDPGITIPRPTDGKWRTSGCVMGDGWSVAWRVLDAQFWGTSDKPLPQRRRRIALVADFGGQSAPEILFVRKSVSGDIEPSEPKRETASAYAQGGIGTDDCYTFEPGIASREGGHIYENVSGTFRANAGDNQMATAYSVENHPADSRVNIDESGLVQTLTSRMGTGGGNVPMVMQSVEFVVADHPTPKVDDKGIAFTTAARDYKNQQCLFIKEKRRYIVRRLTPLECERLQGYPDRWTDIGEWTDSSGKKRQTSDAARYKALGNSIALPPWKWVLKRLCACYERDATMASLFDEIGGFPYLWEQLNGKGSCLWASEIEEFPMAVTKVRIGE